MTLKKKAAPERASKQDAFVAKPARLTVLMDAERKLMFEQLCAGLDTTASEMLRKLIAAFLEQGALPVSVSTEIWPAEHVSRTARSPTKPRK